jgi:hypothetical protein
VREEPSWNGYEKKPWNSQKLKDIGVTRVKKNVQPPFSHISGNFPLTCFSLFADFIVMAKKI